jgi:phosphoribosylformylglycinamidine synthase
MRRDAQLGAEVDLSGYKSLSTRGLLFGEAQARVILSVHNAEGVLAIAKKHGVPARVIGEVVADRHLTIRTSNETLHTSLAPLDDDYFETIPRIMSQAVASS